MNVNPIYDDSFLYSLLMITKYSILFFVIAIIVGVILLVISSVLLSRYKIKHDLSPNLQININNVSDKRIRFFVSLSKSIFMFALTCFFVVITGSMLMQWKYGHVMDLLLRY